MEKNKTKKAAVCPVAKKCGGCEFQGMPYAEQLKHKEKRVRILLDSFGKVHPIIGNILSMPKISEVKIFHILHTVKNTFLFILVSSLVLFCIIKVT